MVEKADGGASAEKNLMAGMELGKLEIGEVGG